MKLTIIILLTLFFNISHAQIGARVKSSSSGYIGEWTNKDFNHEMKLVLNSNGQGFFDGEPLTYSQSGNTLIMNWSGKSIKYTYQIDDNNTLILSGGDLEAMIKFVRNGSNIAVQPPQTSITGPGLTGGWVGTGEELEYKSDGTMIYNGNLLNYSCTDKTITVKTQKGDVNFQYSINGSQLLLSSNGQSFIYTRKGSTENQGNSQTMPSSNTSQGLIGSWVGAGEELEYKTDGTMNYNGSILRYSSTGNTITVQTQNGIVNFQYTINGGYLQLSSNGQSFIYTRKGSTESQGNSQVPQSGNTSGQGVIAPEMVGKWCYMNIYSSGTGGSSTEECFTLYQNGTYEYNNQSSMSATGYNSYGSQTYTGGTAGQSSDRGTWRVQGNNIIVNSQTQGQTIYQFVKQNHPKTGDPMLVINGRSFVTYYQKPPWR